MLYLLAIIIGLIFIVIYFSNGLRERNILVGKNAEEKKMLRDLNKEDYSLLAKILSVGLVDADPNYLSHLKAYRDLRGASS